MQNYCAQSSFHLIVRDKKRRNRSRERELREHKGKGGEEGNGRRTEASSVVDDGGRWPFAALQSSAK
jgi:hypothetical protein